MKKIWINVALAAAVVVIFIASFMIGAKYTDADEAFAGADAQAEQTIKEVAPDYEPWFAPFFEIESGELESGLFAVQAGLGGILFGYAVGTLNARRKTKAESLVE